MKSKKEIKKRIEFLLKQIHYIETNREHKCIYLVPVDEMEREIEKLRIKLDELG